MTEPLLPRHITVTGDAEVLTQPNRAAITLGVETLDKNLVTAKKDNDAVVHRLFGVAEKYQIPARNIQADYLSVEPRYVTRSERSEFLGYAAHKTLVVTLDDVPALEGLLSDLLQAGINRIHDVSFRTTELRKHRDEARALALRAAQEKARALAAELGQTIGKPLVIREERNDWNVWRGMWGARGAGMMSQNTLAYAGSGGADPESTAAPGQVSVTARVLVTFELEG
jgi:uncharacterized protein YggE